MKKSFLQENGLTARGYAKASAYDRGAAERRYDDRGDRDGAKPTSAYDRGAAERLYDDRRCAGPRAGATCT